MISAEWMRRYSIAHFLAALVALLVATPFVEELRIGSLVQALLMTVVLLSAVAAVGEGKRTLLTATLLVAPALIGTWANHVAPDTMPRSGIAAAIAFALFIIYQLLRFILRAQRVNSEVLCASIAAYLMLGIAWAMAYELVWRVAPEAFRVADSPTGRRTIGGFEALYFSFGTLAPINDNDIVPVGNFARLLVMFEAIVGMLYMGMLIARLVGIYSSEEAAEIREPSDDPHAEGGEPLPAAGR
jgi:hypothetical protein